MQVGIRPSGGLRLWDIQFNGQRIVYELALQEAMMSAAGATPSQVTCRVSSALPCPLLPCTCAARHLFTVEDSMVVATAHCKLLSCTCNLPGYVKPPVQNFCCLHKRRSERHAWKQF